MRYTKNSLITDLVELNTLLEDIGYSLRLVYEGRNGYSAIDERYPGQSGVMRNIECGSPRECLAAAYRYVNEAHQRMKRTDDYAVEYYHNVPERFKTA